MVLHLKVRKSRSPPGPQSPSLSTFDDTADSVGPNLESDQAVERVVVKQLRPCSGASPTTDGSGDRGRHCLQPPAAANLLGISFRLAECQREPLAAATNILSIARPMRDERTLSRARSALRRPH